MLNKNVIKDTVEAYFDGSCTTDQTMGWGYIIRNPQKKTDTQVLTGSGTQEPHSENSSNTAEYMGLHDAVITLIQNKLHHLPITFIGDSDLVIKQMTGLYSINSGKYKNTALIVQNLIATHIPHAMFKWIPRKLNEEADKLSKLYRNTENGKTLYPYIHY